MYSTHEAELDLPSLPLAARRVHIVPALRTASLLSMAQLCDAGCTVTFDAVSVIVRLHDRSILHGVRTLDTGLWHLSLVQPNPDPYVPAPPVAPPPITDCSNAAIQSATPAELVAFAHAALFSPALSTLQKAIDNGYLPNFLGLTALGLRKYPPASVAMIKGHLDQSRKNQRSTKLTATTIPTAPSPAPEYSPDDDAFPTSDPDNERTHHCFAAVFEPASGQIHSDQTGKFIVASSSGNNYVLVVYDYDSNSILVAPMRSRTGPCILAAFQAIHARLVAAGLRPQLHRLDNECSVALKTFLRDAEIDYQLVPPRLHRRNAAERAIRTFKNHFIAGLCSVDKNFPLHLWDKLLPQAELTLNLLRGSRLNPKLSAHAQMHGHFDCNRTPLAPPGIRVLVHIKPSERTTWSPHGADGWYTGPALESYRCYTVWLWKLATRICDTLTCHHEALVQLTSILTSLTTDKSDPPPTSITAVEPIVAPPLPDTSLRVAATIPISPTSPTPVPVPPADARLKVVQSPPAPPSLRVTFAPVPAPTGVTFANSTGASGKRRRRNLRLRKHAVVSPPSKTIHPRKFPPATSVPPRTVASHPHGTRSKHLHHVAACARALLIDDARAPQSPFSPSQPLPSMHHCAFHGHAINPDTGKIAEYRELSQCSDGPIWQASNADEIGRLAQGFGAIKGTNTIFFIHPSAMPAGRKATYLRVVSALRPEKVNPYRIRWTVGGDKVDYPFDVSTKTADLTTAKLLINSVVSTPNAKFLTADLKDFYLGTPMSRYEYMRVPIWMLPEAIIEQYNLTPLFHNGYVYVEIRRGMYGLPQAGRLANDQLIACLKPHGYAPCPLTPGLWKHTTRDIVFSLVVDDFGIRYTDRADADHLIATLKASYEVSLDWTGARYCGLTLAWDYSKRTCDVSMPGYIERALQRFQHIVPTNMHKPEHSPHPWQRPNYGATTQYATIPDASPALDAADKTHILEVLGTLLFYARAIDSTMLTAIGELATEQSQATKTTLDKLSQLLNYCASHPDATVRFTASDMILAVESDASYLSVVKGRSRAAGYFFLTNKPLSPDGPYKPNGAVHVLCHIMREVLSSAAEAELGALFHNGKEACPLRIALEEMGHPQPATPMATDNSTASGIATDTVKQKRSKAIDMRFYWIRDRVRQGQFQIYWSKGTTNRADYFFQTPSSLASSGHPFHVLILACQPYAELL
ncbi:Reverse transcriptase (RNA-dependent DNA polymerase) [Fragilaria crotonensis]|nr:Reverse transcriptase (RNA-dependent DNA polymerase) [Fragilaria crotonensis]